MESRGDLAFLFSPPSPSFRVQPFMLQETFDPNELETKGYWLRKFRMAKSLKTLELMVPKALDTYYGQAKIEAAIYLAECQRERELETGILLNR